MSTTTIRAYRDNAALRAAAKVEIDAKILKAAQDPDLSARDLASLFNRSRDYVSRLVGKRPAMGVREMMKAKAPRAELVPRRRR